MAADPSPLARAVARVGDRWTLLVVEALLDGPRRFGEVQAAVTGIAATVLSQRLKHLEREGLVTSRRYSQRPPRHTYALTESGAELAGALLLLTAWGAVSPDETASPAHSLCGTALEPRWYCGTCDATVASPEADELRYA